MFGNVSKNLSGMLGDRSSRAMMGAQMLAAPTNRAAFAAMGQGMALNKDQQKELAERAKKIEYLKSLSNTNPQTIGAVEAGVIDPADAYKSMTKPVGGNASYGKSPVYGEDAQGNSVLGTVGDDGSFKVLDTGEFTPSTGVSKVDLGDRIGIMNKRTGEIVGYEEKNLIGAERDKAIGKAQGANAANLGAATQGLDDTMTLVDSVLEHPSLSAAVGPIDGRLPSFSSGTRDFDERVEQIKNKAFLSARQELKGGGAITDYEGQKAETALVRASQAKSEADFIQAMNEFKQALARGKQLLAMQAGQAPQQPQTQNTGNITPASEYFK